MPDVLVGLEFPQRGEIRWLCQRTKSKEDIYLPFWQFVVRKVSERRLEICALTTNDSLNQEKEVEKIQASLNKYKIHLAFASCRGRLASLSTIM